MSRLRLPQRQRSCSAAPGPEDRAPFPTARLRTFRLAGPVEGGAGLAGSRAVK